MAKNKSSLFAELSFVNKFTVVMLLVILFSMPIALIGVMSGVLRFPSAYETNTEYLSYNILNNSSFEELDENGDPLYWQLTNFKGSDGILESPEAYTHDAFGNPIEGNYALGLKSANQPKIVSQKVDGLNIPAGYDFNFVGWFKVVNYPSVDLSVVQTLYYSDGTSKTFNTDLMPRYFDAQAHGLEVKGRPETIWFQQGLGRLRSLKTVEAYEVKIISTGNGAEVSMNTFSVSVSKWYLVN